MKKIILCFVIIIVLLIGVVLKSDDDYIKSVVDTLSYDRYNNRNDNYGYIYVPKIGLSKRFLYDGNIDISIIALQISENPLKENSFLVLAGHSGSGKYAHFNYLYKLGINDDIFIKYKDKSIKYTITNIYYEKKDGKIKVYRDKNTRTLALVTCTNNIKNTQTIYIAREHIKKQDN